jgi:ParB family chromosome partitioning protein
MIKRRALGKGLGSLIPEPPPAAAPSEAVRYLDPEAMVPNRFQPREAFQAESLEQLTDSIRRNGLLQPILVRPLDGGYEIIAGERRWRAAIQAGLKRIPAVVQSVTEDKALELALVENLQRQDLDAIEEARAFKLLTDRFGLTQEEVASMVGRSRPAVANALRLLKLPADIQELIQSGTLTRGHARALLALEDPEEIRKLAAELQGDLKSVRSTERAARERGSRSTSRAGGGQDPNVHAAQERLLQKLGAKVRIHCDSKGRGRIEIGFGSQEELSRLYDGLMTARF